MTEYQIIVSKGLRRNRDPFWFVTVWSFAQPGVGDTAKFIDTVPVWSSQRFEMLEEAQSVADEFANQSTRNCEIVSWKDIVEEEEE